MLMRIATRTFVSRVHLLGNGAKQTNGKLFDPGVSLRKKVEHSRAHGKKWGARRVGVLKVRRASRCGALIFTIRTEPSYLEVRPNHFVASVKITVKIFVFTPTYVGVGWVPPGPPIQKS